MKKLLILSGKGGTGKTTTASAFLRFSQARAMADCDVDAPNLHLVTNLKGREPEESPFLGSEKSHIDLQKCIGCGKCLAHCRFGAIQQTEEGRCTVSQPACEGCGVCQLVCPAGAVSLLPDRAGTLSLYRGEPVFSTACLRMGRGNSGKLVTAVKLAMLKAAPPDADLAIIDGSPGIGCPVIASISGVDLVLIVTEPSRSGLSDLARLLNTARTFRTQLAVCVNKADASPENTEAIRDFCRREAVPFLGTVPYDKAAAQAVNAGKSLADTDGPARDALLSIYHRVCDLIFA